MKRLDLTWLIILLPILFLPSIGLTDDLDEWHKYREDLIKNISYRKKLMKKEYPKTWKDKVEELERAQEKKLAESMRSASESIYKQIKFKISFNAVLEAFKAATSFGQAYTIRNSEMIGLADSSGKAIKQLKREEITKTLKKELAAVKLWIAAIERSNQIYEQETTRISSELTTTTTSLESTATTKTKEILNKRKSTGKNSKFDSGVNPRDNDGAGGEGSTGGGSNEGDVGSVEDEFEVYCCVRVPEDE